MIGILVVPLVLLLVLMILLPVKLADEFIKGILLIGVAAGLISAVGIIGLTGVGVLTGIRLLVGLGIFDPVIGLVDLIHFLGCNGITGVQIGMIFLCQSSICSFDFFFRSALADAQNLMGISCHDRPSLLDVVQILFYIVHGSGKNV